MQPEQLTDLWYQRNVEDLQRYQQMIVLSVLALILHLLWACGQSSAVLLDSEAAALAQSFPFPVLESARR